jgi:hypothetical protein
MMDVRYAEEVFDDLRPSVDWLNSRKPSLGFELESEFYASVAVVRGRPYSYAVDHTGLRPVRLRRFTAVLYYKIEESLLPDGAVVVIVGLMVGGRDESCLKYRG